MVNPSVYLDYNASAPLRFVAEEALIEGLSYVGNSSSVHTFGRKMRQKLEEARSSLKDSLDAGRATLVLTSGGTESNNLALQAFPGHAVFVTSTSHASVLHAQEDAAILPSLSSGLIDLEALEKTLSDRKTRAEDPPCLVSFEIANNETGVIQPIEDIIRIVKSYGGLVHGDGAQILGRGGFHFQESGLDLFSFSSHKVGGPAGIGGLLVRHGLDPQPLMKGGGQEYGKRAGSNSVPLALGFASSLREAVNEGPSAWQSVLGQRSRIESFVQEKGGTVVAQDSERLPNTCCLRMPGVLAETQIMALDLEGFAVSAGSACSSGKVGASHVLKAMGVPDQEAQETIRLSLCLGTSDKLIGSFLEAWERLFRKASGGHGEKSNKGVLGRSSEGEKNGNL